MRVHTRIKTKVDSLNYAWVARRYTHRLNKAACGAIFGTGMARSLSQERHLGKLDLDLWSFKLRWNNARRQTFGFNCTIILE